MGTSPLLLVSADTLSKAIDKALTAAGAPAKKKNAALNAVAATICGPKRNWGFVRAAKDLVVDQSPDAARAAALLRAAAPVPSSRPTLSSCPTLPDCEAVFGGTHVQISTASVPEICPQTGKPIGRAQAEGAHLAVTLYIKLSDASYAQIHHRIDPALSLRFRQDLIDAEGNLKKLGASSHMPLSIDATQDGRRLWLSGRAGANIINRVDEGELERALRTIPPGFAVSDADTMDFDALCENIPDANRVAPLRVPEGSIAPGRAICQPVAQGLRIVRGVASAGDPLAARIDLTASDAEALCQKLLRGKPGTPKLARHGFSNGQTSIFWDRGQIRLTVNVHGHRKFEGLLDPAALAEALDVWSYGQDVARPEMLERARTAFRLVAQAHADDIDEEIAAARGDLPAADRAQLLEDAIEMSAYEAARELNLDWNGDFALNYGIDAAVDYIVDEQWDRLLVAAAELAPFAP